ncbi:MAG: alpha/beta fold hydrolase [Chloroflexi bacterium]|nr:alpha/beta fold hydrolase [Chloroflexota bacterium]
MDRKRLLGIIFAAGMALIIGFGTCLPFADQLLAPPTPTPSPEATPQATTPPPLDRVAFRTTDGVLLEGRLYDGGGMTGVVLAHMFPADQESWAPFAETLKARGYKALIFNFRGYGRSGGNRQVSQIDKDVEGAIAYLRGQGIHRIFVVGASMGGTASVIAGNRQEVAGVVTLSSPRIFQGLDATQAGMGLKVPGLFVAAEDDGQAPVDARWFQGNAAGPARALVVSGDAHGTNIFGAPTGDQARESLLSFLEDPVKAVGGGG